MTAGDAPEFEGAATGIRDGLYTSTLFERFVDAVTQHGQGSEVLDLGPTTAENLMFWVGRGHRLAAVDLYARYQAGETLGLEGRGFAGILAWNLLSALPADVAATIAGELRELLVPGGAIFAIFDGDGRRPPPPVRYRIVNESRLRFEPNPTVDEMRPVSTNEIDELLHGLGPARLSVMRHGSREVLGQRPAPRRVPFPDAPFLPRPKVV